MNIHTFLIDLIKFPMNTDALIDLLSLVETMRESLVEKYAGEPGIIEVLWLETGITTFPDKVVECEKGPGGHVWYLAFEREWNMFYLATSSPLTLEGVEVKVEGSQITFRAGDAEIAVEEEYGSRAKWEDFLLSPWQYHTTA